MSSPIGIYPGQGIFMERAGDHLIIYLELGRWNPTLLRCDFKTFNQLHIVALKGDSLPLTELPQPWRPIPEGEK